VSTGGIVAIGAGVVALGGTVLFVMHRQSQAALQAQAAAAAAANRAAQSAKHDDFSLGNLLTVLGGKAIDAAAAYYSGGASAVLSVDSRKAAQLV
jgi:uncharacterized protein (UPF0333 family)